MKKDTFDNTDDEESFYEQVDDFNEDYDDSSDESRSERLAQLVKEAMIEKEKENFFLYFELAYNRAGTLLCEGIINIIYGVSVLIALIWFRDYLDSMYRDWFDLSLSIPFLLIALDFEVTYRRLKREGDSGRMIRFRALLNLLAGVLIFLFPSFFQSFIFGVVAFVLFVVGLTCLMRRVNFTFKRVLGVLLIIMSALLIFLPIFSRLYYQYYLASLILLRGIVQVFVSNPFFKKQREVKELEEGFTDYTIE